MASLHYLVNMYIKVIPALLLCLCASTLFADQVVLKNGDRVTGDIVKKDGKTITIKTAAFGVITAAWDQVESITTEKPVTVELKGGEVYNGTLTVKQDSGTIQAPKAPQEVTLAEIAIVRDAAEQKEFEKMMAPPWSRLWAGRATLGFAGTKGNAETQTLTMGMAATRATRKDKTQLRFSAIKASALIANTSASTAEAVRGGWGYDRNVGRRMFINTFNDYEFDRFQNLDLRFVLGGGVGYMVYKGEKLSLDVLGGGAFNRESFASAPKQNAFTRQSAEAYFGNELSWKLNGLVSLTQSSRLFPNLTNTGEYRFNFDTGANTKLTKWLTWNTTISNRLLSNPNPGRAKNDFLYSTGFGINFSR